MCFPIAALGMTAAQTAMAGISMAMSVMGGMQQSKMAQYNADVQRQQAADAQRRGGVAEEAQRLKTQQMIGAQRAAAAANGVDISSGTPVDLLTQSAGFGERDAQNIRVNAAREAWGHQASAAQYDAQASNAMATGFMKAGGTLLGNISPSSPMAQSLNKWWQN